MTPPAPPFWKLILCMHTFLPCHIPDRRSCGANRILPDLAFGFVHKRSGNEIRFCKEILPWWVVEFPIIRITCLQIPPLSCGGGGAGKTNDY